MRYEMGVPLPDRGDRCTGMTKIIREMPIGSSILFETQAEAISCANMLKQNLYVAARRRRILEKHGEEGWRVWKLGEVK